MGLKEGKSVKITYSYGVFVQAQVHGSAPIDAFQV